MSPSSERGPTRRELLVASGALAVGACAPRPGPADAGPRWLDPQPYDGAARTAFAPAEIAASEALFPQTVGAGVMRADSVTLWTRAVGAASITLRVWREVGSQTEVALVSERVLAVPADGNVKVAVGGLAPATWYRYGFFAGDWSARSPLGRVRTAFPDDWSEPLTVGTTSCTKATNAPYAALALMAEQPIDLWLHLGDVSYNDGAVTLADFRARWRAQLADPGYRALLPAAGLYPVWDDHDFLNNFDPEALGPDDPALLAAKQAFLETLPVEVGANDRLWRSYRWGRTAEFFVMDCRTERLPSTRQTPQAQYLSRAQLDWLEAGVASSPCHFKVLLNSVPITNMPPPTWGGQADRWQGYPAAREELLGFLEANDVRNVWFMSGDFHLGLVMRVERAGARSRYLEICGGPGGNLNPLALLLAPGQEANRKVAFPPDQFLFVSGGFASTAVTFDPTADTVRVVFKDSVSRETTHDQTYTFGS